MEPENETRGNQVVMVVDDEPYICRFFERVLGDEGYKVVSTTSGRRALALAPEIRPNLVLMDIVMPDMDGVATLRGLRSGGYQGPVIMVTGKGTIQTAREAMVLDAYQYITKPFDLEFVRSVIREVFRVHAERQKEIACAL
jgi:DNA-binding NtrC family response regulator